MVRRLAPVLLLLSVIAFAQGGIRLRSHSFGDVAAAQRVLLSNYCRLDFEGSRLQPETWPRIKPLTNFKTNPDFSSFVIVSRYDIDPQEDPSEIVYVTYQSVGRYEYGGGFTPAYGDRVAYRVQEKSGEVVVTELEPATPHVSVRAALAWMKARLQDPKANDIDKAQLNDAIQKLTALSQPAKSSTASQR